VESLSEKVDPTAFSLVKRLRQAGYQAVFVGGCVRDGLLGKQPKDWDIATEATPEEIERIFARTIPVGKAFGVMLVHEDGKDYEVATFRTEAEYHDGRRPDKVKYAGLREDATRRDFTINALMYDPVTDRILDYVGGKEDLEQGVVRTVGVPLERFNEDKLRLIRAVRFAARTGFELEEETLKAMQNSAPEIAEVSGERIGEELRRMFSEGAAENALLLLERSALIEHVLPEVAGMKGVPQPEAFHPEGDVMTHTRLMCHFLDETIRFSMAQEENCQGYQEEDGRISAGLREDEQGGKRLCFPGAAAREILAWAVLLHDVGKPSTLQFAERIRFDLHDRKGAEIAQDVLRRLRRPNRVVGPVCEIIGRHMRFSEIPNMRTAKRRRWLNDELFPYDLELHRIDSEGSHGKMDTYFYALNAWEEERVREPEPEPLLRGRDLIEMGYKPGPRMGRILAAVEDARLENRIGDADEAREWVRHHFPLNAENEPKCRS